MPLSPADFYAYSKATGTEYPEDPQSRAALAPEVAEWRRNQLKAPREESDAIDTAGKLALGAGIAAGAYGLSRGGRFGRLRESIAGAVRPKDRGATGGVAQVKLAREAAPAVEKVVKQDPDVIKRATQDLNRLAESVEAPAATVAPSTGQASTLFQYERRSLPYPGARERAREQFARSLEAPAATVTESTGQVSTLSETDRAEQLARVYRQEIVDREINREAKVKKEIAAMKEGAAMRVIDDLRAEAKQERAAATVSESNAISRLREDVSEQIQAQESPGFAEQYLGQKGYVDAPGGQQATLVETQEVVNQPKVSAQSFDAASSASDQLDAIAESEIQRDIDSVRLGKQEVAAEKLSGFGRFSRDATATETGARAQRQFLEEDWSGGVPDYLVDDLGQAMQEAKYDREFTAFDLRGTPESLPGYGEMRIKQRKGVIEASRRALGRAQQPLVEGGRRIGMTETEIADRISAAANYKRGSVEHQALLNPDLPTSEVRGLLGSTLRVSQGRVGTNLTSEITPGARASMTEVQDELMQRAKQKKEAVVDTDFYDFGTEGSDIDVDTGRRFSDYDENVADYGDVEGPGGLVETYAFKERTNKDTTMVPGMVSDAEAEAPGSLRQEREIDRQIPTRSTLEGDTSRGFFIKENTGKLTFEGASTRLGEKRTGLLETTDPNVEGSKLAGNFEPTASPTPAIQISGKDVIPIKTDFGSMLKLRPGVENRETSFVFDPNSDKVNVMPIMVDKFVERGGQQYRVTEPVYTSLLNKQGKPTSIDRSLLSQIGKDANEIYFNSARGKKGDPLDHANFLADYMDQTLRSQYDIDLPVLRDIKSRHQFVTDVTKTAKDSPVYGKPVIGTTKGGRPKLGESQPLPAFETITRMRGGKETQVTVPAATPTQRKGLGGISPMQVEDAEGYDLPVSYYTPRIETAPQVTRFRNRETGEIGDILTVSTSAMGPQGQLSTGEVAPQSKLSSQQTVPTYGSAGVQLTSLRNLMETQPLGLRTPYLSNIGGEATATTKRPYTGAGAAAYGAVKDPIGTSLAGTRRLNLEPTTGRQEANLLEFTRTAEQTPGGRVVPGAVNLGGGMGIIEGGIGPYTESETISRYGVSGKEVKRLGDQLMYQAALRRNR